MNEEDDHYRKFSGEIEWTSPLGVRIIARVDGTEPEDVGKDLELAGLFMGMLEEYDQVVPELLRRRGYSAGWDGTIEKEWAAGYEEAEVEIEALIESGELPPRVRVKVTDRSQH